MQVSLDNDFATEGKFITLPTTYPKAKMEVDASEIAVAQTTLAVKKGVKEDKFPFTSKLYVRLRAALTSGKGEVYSNVISINARTHFALTPAAVPSTMNVIGSTKGIGEWNWAGSVPMVQTWAKDGTFWRILYFEAGTSMKFNVEKKFDGGEFGSSAKLVDNASAGLSDDGGNLKVANAGWYLVVIKTTAQGRDLKYTVSFEKPNVYLIGDVSVGGKWEITAETAGSYRPPWLLPARCACASRLKAKTGGTPSSSCWPRARSSTAARAATRIARSRAPGGRST